MPVTLLAVDDSVTMRKVFEMTFDGESFHVLTADSADAALAMIKREKPALVLADITLPGKTGYDLCAAIKRDHPNLPVVLMSSKLNPYDRARGTASKADDNVDKPFDTQKLIDKVNGLLSLDKAAAMPPTVGPRGAAPMGATLVGQGAPAFRQQGRPAVPASPLAGGQTLNLRGTVEFSSRSPARPQVRSSTPGSPPQAPGAAAAPVVAVQPKPVPQQRPPAAHPSPSGSPQPSTAPTMPAMKTVSAQPQPVAAAEPDVSMSQKLSTLGLTKEQVEGVMALSRDLIERVVWEVVPVLAETIIKEEIKRLTEEK